MSPEELQKAQIRMTAMQAAITLYCCHRGSGGGPEVPPEPIEELLPQLMRLRDMLLATATVPGPI